ncbi:hypothetical protein BKA70DRAFT_1146120 [Coprinopsis sp. MPI-PUGE-AT-0042]|nr:hypothetical protein BKA70DRAFT_1146120 [Coprinopsis sp. MPI-PUGE-AT-0042]
MAESSSEIQVNVKGPSELKLQINISTDQTVLELKQAIAGKSDVPADRQRLIYSGKVLKDEDVISVYKIQSSHTIHMVKGAAKPSSSSTSSASPSTTLGSTTGGAAQALPRMQTGQNVHDPLTQLNSHMGFGAMAGLNPFAEMGLNPNDPNMLQTMMNSPEFLQQMSSMLSNPAVMEQAIAQNPQLQQMAPQIRESLNSPMFREMMSNPDSLRMMMQMSQMMQGGGAGGFPNPFGAGGGAFPAPGVPAGGTVGTTGATTGTPGATGTAGTPGTGFGAAGTPGAAGNPVDFMQQMQQMQQMFGAGGPFGMGAGAGGWGSPAVPATPADTRPPEERFQVQLQQLQDMGFTNAQQNVRALLATGGNVHSAIEYILGGGGI